MCGICGEIDFRGAPASVEAVQKMVEKMEPRGPDAGGVFAQGAVSLGHRRLKIIDLSEHAQQPMVDSELGLVVVFNGCIYNYKTLRATLQEKGYRFFSTGDTEVVLKAYHEWGTDFVSHLNGMFAFAILERDTGRVILGRDRFGIKPLYLAPRSNGLRFASTLPALLAAGEVDTAIDPVGLHHYMHWHAVVPPPHTILQGVQKLPPATVRTIEADGQSADWTYWRLTIEESEADAAVDEAEWQERLLDSLRTRFADGWSPTYRWVFCCPAGWTLA